MSSTINTDTHKPGLDERIVGTKVIMLVKILTMTIHDENNEEEEKDEKDK